jgi:predicted hydrocarbon binding protein
MMLRARLAMQIAKRVIRRSYRSSRTIARLRRGEGTLTVRGSIFCVVRAPFKRPLCVYYSAALSRLLALLELEGEVRVHTCCGVGQEACVISMTIPALQK